MSSITRLFRRDPNGLPAQPLVAGRPARVPPNIAVYAIGDLHGRLDCLDAMHELIREDAEGWPSGTECVVVYMGDYVDRGPSSSEVIDRLLSRPLQGFHAIHLVGNHDAWLMAFLEDITIAPAWLRHGGDTTLRSYGLSPIPDGEDAEALDVAQAAFRTLLPPDHLSFFEGLSLYYELGDYLFVHAGVRPAWRLSEQQPEDLIWIREPFLSSTEDYGRVVVHGHTVTSTPAVRSNRIGIDTGACWTGQLTCLVLHRTTFRFLSTPPD